MNEPISKLDPAAQTRRLFEIVLGELELAGALEGLDFHVAASALAQALAALYIECYFKTSLDAGRAYDLWRELGRRVDAAVTGFHAECEAQPELTELMG